MWQGVRPQAYPSVRQGQATQPQRKKDPVQIKAFDLSLVLYECVSKKPLASRDGHINCVSSASADIVIHRDLPLHPLDQILHIAAQRLGQHGEILRLRFVDLLLPLLILLDGAKGHAGTFRQFPLAQARPLAQHLQVGIRLCRPVRVVYFILKRLDTIS